jgi:Na+-transporting methylmalonyl-CoA/oxaloacetate decarboxylase gamma subunit
MNPQSFNPRMVVTIVFAFLIIVALFLRPGGTAEQATEKLTEVAQATQGKPQAPASAAPTRVPSAAWYAADPQPVTVPVAPDLAAQLPPEAPAGAPPVVAEPLPQGPDFPENR